MYSYSPCISQPILIHNSLLQGFHDTSLTIGEAAAVLWNYERRTGDVLRKEDLTDKILAMKLTPEDYNIKGQVSPHLITSVQHAYHLTLLVLKRFTLLLNFCKSLPCRPRTLPVPRFFTVIRLRTLIWYAL